MLEALFEQSSSEATQKLKLLPNEEKKQNQKNPTTYKPLPKPKKKKKGKCNTINCKIYD